MVDALTQRHRAQQLLLRRATKAQGEQLFKLLNWGQLDSTFPTFAVSAASLVAKNRQTSAGLSASYFRNLRKSKGIRTDVSPVIVSTLNVEQFTATIHATSVAALKGSAARGVAADVAMSNAASLTKGALARLVLSAGRETVLASVSADDRATGWIRVLGGEGCPYCQERAGLLFQTEAAGDFDAHGNCACSAEPVFE